MRQTQSSNRQALPIDMTNRKYLARMPLPMESGMISIEESTAAQS